MKILVVSGFLGAGKTTFIRELISRVKKDCAIVENEYGEIGVDGKILSAEEGLTVRELSEGCICCSAKTDFSASVLTIANTLDPEVLIVEPSGVGLPGNILSNLRQIEYERIVLLRPVALADVRAFFTGLAQYPEIARNQISSASTVLLTKTAGMDGADIDRVADKIKEINPAAQIIREDYRTMPESWFESLLLAPMSAKAVTETTAELPEQCAFTRISLPSGYALLLFLEGVVSGVFGEIYRAKGYLKTGNAVLKFDVVENRYTVTGAEEMSDSRAVFIGKKIKRNLLRQALLKEFRADATLLLNAKRTPKKR